jgi:hypothetical protein
MKPKYCRASPGSFRAEEFAALRDFLRGYLHEDYRSEYGSPEKAAAAFLAEADTRERGAAAAQLARFLEFTHALPSEETLHLFRQELGSGWNPGSVNALRGLLTALQSL